jgi:hypothetical protein
MRPIKTEGAALQELDRANGLEPRTGRHGTVAGRGTLLLPSALLVAVLTKLLATLVLVDLGLPAFLERTHIVVFLFPGISPKSVVVEP